MDQLEWTVPAGRPPQGNTVDDGHTSDRHNPNQSRESHTGTTVGAEETAHDQATPGQDEARPNAKNTTQATPNTINLVEDDSAEEQTKDQSKQPPIRLAKTGPPTGSSPLMNAITFTMTKVLKSATKVDEKLANALKNTEQADAWKEQHRLMTTIQEKDQQIQNLTASNTTTTDAL